MGGVKVSWTYPAGMPGTDAGLSGRVARVTITPTVISA